MATASFNLVVPSANGLGAAVDVSTLVGEKTLTFSGNIQATVTVLVSIAGAAGPFFPVVSFTGPTKQIIEVACSHMRVLVSGYITGSAALDVTALTTTTFKSAAPAVPAANGVGAASATPDWEDFHTVICTGTFSGAVVLQISGDNSDWSDCMVFNEPGIQSKVFSAQFVRLRRAGVPDISVGNPVVNVAAVAFSSGGGGGGGGGGLWTTVGTLAAPTTMAYSAAYNEMVLCDASGGTFAVTLPSSAGATAGENCVGVTNLTSDTTAISIVPDGTDTINGSTDPFILNQPFGSISFVSDGAGNWSIW